MLVVICIKNKLNGKYVVNAFLDSPYRDDINQAILQLQEDRTIKHLRDNWWITENVPIIDGVPTNCTTFSTEKSEELDISHVLGSFLVLTFGMSISILIGISEFLWNVRKISVAQKVFVFAISRVNSIDQQLVPCNIVNFHFLQITPYKALCNELLFVCKV